MVVLCGNIDTYISTMDSQSMIKIWINKEYCINANFWFA